ncbi:MAG: DUF1566 domain-containing protein [Desulfobacteraceae bacterium]|nr:DUF1566 domain-containing protein [Desulfobacteraceae bacterium]
MLVGDFYFTEDRKIAEPSTITTNSKEDSDLQDGYKINQCGSITDTKTDLEWYIGPDKNLTWEEAINWTRQLNACGGGWRMPTISEIKTLYNPNLEAGTGFLAGGQYWKAHIHPVFQAIGGGSWVWSNESVGNTEARSFNLNQGKAVKYSRSNITYSTRAFAVR